MSIQRRDLLLLAPLAATAAMTAAFGQAVTPPIGPTGRSVQGAASIADFYGIWSHRNYSPLCGSLTRV